MHGGGKKAIFAVEIQVETAMPRRNILLLLFVAVAVLSLMTGCGSSRKSAGGGQSYPAGNDRQAVELALRDVEDPMARALIEAARGWLGTKYVYGGATKQGTDCSGLIMSLFRDVCEIKIPRTTRDQVHYCSRVARNRIRPGDLVFFANGGGTDNVSHVGLYIGDGRMIHASSSRGVMVSSFDSGYWGDRYCTGARVDGAPKAYARRVGKLPPAGPVVSPVEPENQPLQAAAKPDAPALPVAVDVAQQPTVDAPSGAPQPAMTIDLLDLIINQKIDSIASADFAD